MTRNRKCSLSPSHHYNVCEARTASLVLCYQRLASWTVLSQCGCDAPCPFPPPPPSPHRIPANSADTAVNEVSEAIAPRVELVFRLTRSEPELVNAALNRTCS